MPAAATLWHVKHKEHDGTLIADIRPENLQFNLNRTPPHTIQYEMALSRPEVSHDFIGPYRTDFELWYGTNPIMGGPHTSLNVQYGDDHCTIYGKDWFHLLERTQYPFDPRPSPPFTPSHVNDFVIGTPSQGLAFEIANGDVRSGILKPILDKALSRPYAPGIIYPTFSAGIGILDNFSLALGDTMTMAGLVDQMAQVDPGFVYEVLFGKELRIYSPHKYDEGVVTNPALANYVFDGTNNAGIEELDFTNNGPLATHLFGQGPGIGQSNYGAALGYGPSQAVYRRLSDTVDFSERPNRNSVLKATRKTFSEMLNPNHEITFKMDPARVTNFWTLFQPGYALWFNLDLIAHQLNSAQEIVQMNCSVSNEGDAIVDFGLEQIYAGTAGVQEG